MCEFCKNYNFARAKAEVIENDANIYLSLCNSKFPKEQQFKYCPVCGANLNENKINYDRIRNMSVEEFAKWIIMIVRLYGGKTPANVKQWLEAEVTE